MDGEDRITQGLAFWGTFLIWLPLILPLSFFLYFWLNYGVTQVDWLMPAELFLVFLLGALLLHLAARRAQEMMRTTLAGPIVAVLFLGAAQFTALYTGMATGVRDATGWPLYICTVFLVLYSLFVLFMGLVGIAFYRSLAGPK